MAYDANPDATFNPSVGGTPTAAWGDLINANFAYQGAAWASYTPTWTGSVSNPAIGNGTLTAAYRQVGRTVEVRIHLVVGGTTTFGSGDWRFSLPNSTTNVGHAQPGSGMAFDASATTTYVLASYAVASATYISAVSNASTVSVRSTSPFTWATSDELWLQWVGEVA